MAYTDSETKTAAKHRSIPSSSTYHEWTAIHFSQRFLPLKETLYAAIPSIQPHQTAVLILLLVLQYEQLLSCKGPKDPK